MQFPIVAVAGLNEGLFPRPATGGRDPVEVEERARRLFFVACSRAMNRLLVVGSRLEPSPFFDFLQMDDWEDYE